MDDLIADIEFAVAHGRWHLALAGTLALPDVCAAVQSTNGQTTGSKYKNWVRSHLADKYPRLDPDELYKMRCSLLHQGTSSTLKYSRVIFCAPDSRIQAHNAVFHAPEEAALVLDLPQFCSDVIAAVMVWRQESQGSANYKRNIEKLMRWRSDGVAPFFDGIQVLT